MKWRKAQGLSRERLAVLLGVNYWTLTRIERGCSVSISKRLAERLRSVGYPGNAKQDYERWRARLRNKLREKVLRES